MKLLIVGLLGILLLADVARAASVRGVITREDTHRPVAYALVIFFQGGREIARRISTEDGFYYISDLAPGTYDVLILHRSVRNQFTRTIVGSSRASLDFQISPLRR